VLHRGSLRLDTWEDKNGGGKRSKLYVVADTWEFVGGGRGEGAGAGAGGREPMQRSAAASEGAGGPGGAESEPAYGERESAAEDTPF
jgi:single-strand DNA-binding protein